MGGPIVRTGATPEFWKNWDNIFGDKKDKGDEESKKPAPKKSAAKTTKAKAKTAKKKAAKKK